MSKRESWASIANELDGSAEIARLESELEDLRCDMMILESIISRLEVERDALSLQLTEIQAQQ